MSIFTSSNLHALCLFDAGAVGAFITNLGFSSFLRNGAGDYTLTYTNPIDPTECVPSAQVLEAGDTTISAERVNDNTIRVRTLTAGVAADVDFALTVQRTF